MSTYLAWENAFHHKRRSLVTIISMSFALLLVFMQLGFADTARRAHTLLYEMLEFDLMMISDRFESLKNPRDFPAARLFQVKTIEGVRDAAGLNVEWAAWLDPVTEVESTCMLVGIDLNPAFIRDADVRNNLEAIRDNNAVMIDRLSEPAYGRIRVRMPGKINDTNVAVKALFRLGADFKADGRAIASNATYYGLQRETPEMVSMGMIDVLPGQDIQRVKADLSRSMPPDVLFLDREELIRDEQDYYTEVKPIGLFFKTGVVIAFCVGAVILFQVLATDIASRFREFATLKALGLHNGFLYAVGSQQALIYAVLSYIPALLIASGVFYVVHLITRLPISMNLSLAGYVLLLALLMCAVSGFLALQKVRRADPAELY